MTSNNPSLGSAGVSLGADGNLPADLIKDTTTAAFMDDVVRASMQQPVLVDFWAPWCGPCRQLTPVLEKVVREARGAVKLVKMNIDEHPAIAGQLGVQSIPAVFAFRNGQPVDAFLGALPESKVREFIAQLGAEAPDPVADALEQARAALEAGDHATAGQVFSAVLQHDPDNVDAVAGLAETLMAMGETDRAKEVLDRVPAERRDTPAIAGILARIALAEQVAGLGDPAELTRRIEANPDDHQARFDLALIHNARGDREAAATALLEIVRRDRQWQEDGARQQLLKFFEAWGATDPATVSARRRLSSLLFS